MSNDVPYYTKLIADGKTVAVFSHTDSDVYDELEKLANKNLSGLKLENAEFSEFQQFQKTNIHRRPNLLTRKAKRNEE